MARFTSHKNPKNTPRVFKLKRRGNYRFTNTSGEFEGKQILAKPSLIKRGLKSCRQATELHQLQYTFVDVS